MSQTYKNPFTKLILEMMIFLEFSDEESINSDIAIEFMEKIGFYLQNLKAIDKINFISDVNMLCTEYDDIYKEYVKNIPMNLGILI